MRRGAARLVGLRRLTRSGKLRRLWPRRQVLVERARLKKGERVLIHSAAGGVGIADSVVREFMRMQTVINPEDADGAAG